MKNDFGGLLVTGGDVTYVPHQNWRTDTLREFDHAFKLVEIYQAQMRNISLYMYKNLRVITSYPLRMF